MKWIHPLYTFFSLRKRSCITKPFRQTRHTRNLFLKILSDIMNCFRNDLRYLSIRSDVTFDIYSAPLAKDSIPKQLYLRGSYVHVLKNFFYSNRANSIYSSRFITKLSETTGDLNIVYHLWAELWAAHNRRHLSGWKHCWADRRPKWIKSCHILLGILGGITGTALRRRGVRGETSPSHEKWHPGGRPKSFRSPVSRIHYVR